MLYRRGIMNNLFQNGSKWLRADFHLHTKADSEFVYSGNDDVFVSDYINKLIEQDIRLAVITNHNKFDKGEFVALKKKANENGIALFPGVEISLKTSIHILVVFEDAWYKGHDDKINLFLSNALYPIQNPGVSPYQISNKDLPDIVDMLNKVGHSYFIVLAHIDDDNGLCKISHGLSLNGFIEQEAFTKVLALQKSGNKANYDKICEISKRTVACVEGSDNAKEGINGIGKGRVTYLKVGDFNFDALQYALIDCENRVSAKVFPQVRNSHIKSISIEGGLLNGEEIRFSPELNNFIGIRGSGKSAIIEVLRYTLNIPLGSQSVDKDYKDSLIQYVLKSGGKVIVEIENHQNKVYRIERIYGNKPEIYIGDELMLNISLDAIIRQPIYFGQKDLSNKHIDFENDLVNKLAAGRFGEINKKIEDQKQVILRLINELQTLQNLSDIKKETEKVKADTEHKMKMYHEKGVADKLKIQTSFESDISKITTFRSNLAIFISGLDNLIQNNYQLLFQPLQSEINKEIFTELNKQITLFKSNFEDLNVILTSSKDTEVSLDSILQKLLGKTDELKEEFAKLKREIDIPDINPDEYINLNRLLETSKIKLTEIVKSENKRENLSNQLYNELISLDNLWLEKFTIIKDEVQKLNEGNTKITVDIEYKAQKPKFFGKLQDTFKGSNIRKTSYESIVDKYIDFIHIYKDNFQGLREILDDKYLNEFKNIFFKNWYELLTFKVENIVTFKYNGKPLKDLSLGQRASALLLFLLAQEDNDILIIDQPEDDLDNQTIYNDVIREIKKLKGSMQFIFATHNANIPVLGDSEMIVSCQFADEKKIYVESGSIDCHTIQEKIVSIMEGGKEAFDNRYKIYKIWEQGIK